MGPPLVTRQASNLLVVHFIGRLSLETKPRPRSWPTLSIVWRRLSGTDRPVTLWSVANNNCIVIDWSLVLLSLLVHWFVLHQIRLSSHWFLLIFSPPFVDCQLIGFKGFCRQKCHFSFIEKVQIASKILPQVQNSASLQCTILVYLLNFVKINIFVTMASFRHFVSFSSKTKSFGAYKLMRQWSLFWQIETHYVWLNTLRLLVRLKCCDKCISGSLEVVISQVSVTQDPLKLSVVRFMSHKAYCCQLYIFCWQHVYSFELRIASYSHDWRYPCAFMSVCLPVCVTFSCKLFQRRF